MEEGRGNLEWVRGGMNELGLEGSRWRGRDTFQEQHWWRWEGRLAVLSNPRITPRADPLYRYRENIFSYSMQRVYLCKLTVPGKYVLLCKLYLEEVLPEDKGQGVLIPVPFNIQHHFKHSGKNSVHMYT